MATGPSQLTRRLFLALPLLAPTAAWAATRNTAEHRFRYDDVLGTSLDLAVWTRSEDDAARVEGAVLAEIARLTEVLSTYSPASEISRLEHSSGSFFCSRELFDVLSAYAEWRDRTGGAVAAEIGSATLMLSPAQRIAVRRTSRLSEDDILPPLNVDALGKAYIVDRAAAAARAVVPTLSRLVLNIGGDIVVSGPAHRIQIANPLEPHDNAPPLVEVTLSDCAIATSGSYARTGHLRDARSGGAAASAAAGSATVIAPDCVTANALATAACVLAEDDALHLVENTAGAAALLVRRDGTDIRSARFPFGGRPRMVPALLATDWPAGYQLSFTLTITGMRDGFRAPRPYVAVWAEDPAGQLVRTIAVWGDRTRYLMDLTTFWNLASHDETLLYSVTRATRAPGAYRLLWDGLDNHGKPVPAGSYRIIIETSQEHGSYSKQQGTIVCAGAPATVTLRQTENFDAVAIQYGPRSSAA